jgi:thymidylate kinase
MRLVPGDRPIARTGTLLDRLAAALHTRSISYCQWKGMWKLGTDGDIDLLVDRDAIPRFRSLIQELGFTSVLPSGVRQIPGVESYLGYDPLVAHPVHLHVHYHLVVGDYWRTTYRLPIEKALLENSQAGELFRVPAPAFQLLVYVLRMMLRLRGWPLPLSRARWLGGIQGQLDYLEGRCDREPLAAVLGQHLPIVDLGLFDRCLQALRWQTDPAESAAVRRGLHRRLRAHSNRPSIGAFVSACGEKLLPLCRPLLSDGRMRPSRGGLVVALVGADGAGKSTCARELCDWLGGHLPTLHAHLGRPPRSLLTLIVGGALKVEQFWYRRLDRNPPVRSYIALLRHLCTARDRYRLYCQLRQYAVAGGVVISERYPIPQNRPLVGPCIPELLGTEPPSYVARTLRDLESRYYNSMLPPDTLFVLQLHPELAVARKTDEPADYVRARAKVVWETDWSSSPAQIIDASRPLADVVLDLKTRLWATL